MRPRRPVFALSCNAMRRMEARKRRGRNSACDWPSRRGRGGGIKGVGGRRRALVGRLRGAAGRAVRRGRTDQDVEDAGTGGAVFEGDCILDHASGFVGPHSLPGAAGWRGVGALFVVCRRGGQGRGRVAAIWRGAVSVLLKGRVERSRFAPRRRRCGSGRGPMRRWAWSGAQAIAANHRRSRLARGPGRDAVGEHVELASPWARSALAPGSNCRASST